MSGFIPVKRSLFKHFLFKERRAFSRFEAWLDLIQMASFTDDNKELINGKMMERNRGEVIASLRFLMDRWGWSMSKVSDFIELLRSQDMVVVDKESGVTKMLLVNFEKHNSIEEKNSKGIGKKNTQKIGTDADVGDKGTAKSTQTDAAREQRGSSEGANIIKNNKGNTGDSGAVAPAHSEEEEKLFTAFKAWIDKYAPRVNRMKSPITITEYLKLRKKLPKDVIQHLLMQMQNRGDLLTKYVSAYLTITNWAKREQNQLSNGPAATSEINERLKAAGKPPAGSD